MSDESIPKSKVRRLGVVGKTSVSMGAKKASYLAKSAFLNKEKKDSARQRNQQEMAEILFKGLTQLRGTALKIAQALCSETGFLPPHYLKELQKACYQVPPLNKAVVHKTLSSELGEPPHKIFAQFDSTAVAAASLGQVHRATTHEGLEVAVKIQYPGIHQTIESDLSLMKKMMAVMGPNPLLERTFEEVRQSLLNETDYEKELDQYNWFGQHNLPVLIPQGLPQYSTKRVLTTTWAPGLHLDQWLDLSPTKPTIDKVADQLMKFFWSCLIEHQVIHSDPNLGNYLLQDNGEITVIDFGSTKKVTNLESQTFAALWAKNFDAKQVAELYRQLGAKFSNDAKEDFIASVILPYRRWAESLPLRLSQSESYVTQGQQTLNESSDDPRLAGFSVGFTMIHRTFFGLLQAMQKMQAEINLIR